ncbi:hypothetical protein EJB05_03534 [Eragrostis curvula]|uniref:Hyaluronan/mRNA-binding protein domain-containing protein n=1 Tax=Eragrostis curvula TaxID=38414 RepID=A0A5J9W5V5_9POAL|nr:hypothetical protein EJB05_03534 [Eragrostis curvula]
MANLFDLLDLADGESGADAVSTVVGKKRAEAEAAAAVARAKEAADRAAAKVAAKEKKREDRRNKAKREATHRVWGRRAAARAKAGLPPVAEEDQWYTDSELDEEVRVAIAKVDAEEIESEDEEEYQPAPPKASQFVINKKQDAKKDIIDRQIKLTKEQKKLLDEQISLLDKQKKMSEENGENVDKEAQRKLMKEQKNLREEQRKLMEEQNNLVNKKERLTAELGKDDIKGHAKELWEVQKIFKEAQSNFIEEVKNFREEQRQKYPANERRGQWYDRNNYNGGNDNYSNGNGNGGYGRGNSNGHYYNNYSGNGNGGYSRGNGNGNNGSWNLEVYSGDEFYTQGYDERVQEGGDHYYSGERQGYRGGNTRKQIYQRKDKAASDAGTEAEHKPEEKVAPASETEQKAETVNGDAVPASGSEKSSIGGAPNGQGGPKTKNFIPKVKLNGSEKRKLKRQDTADGSKKSAGNEVEKEKQESAVDVSKKQVAKDQMVDYAEEARKVVTLDEYEKVLEEKKNKSMEATSTVVRKVTDEDFKGLQLLKKEDEEEANTKAEKHKGKERAEKGQDKKAAALAAKSKEVVLEMYKRPPRRPDQEDGPYNRGRFNGGFQGRGRDNSTESRGSGRGDNGRAIQDNGSGVPRGTGGYSGSDRRDGYRGNGGHQPGYGGRGNGNGNGDYQQGGNNGRYQERSGNGGYSGRGNGRFQQRGYSERAGNSSAPIIQEADFPALPGTAKAAVPAPAPASAPAPAPAPAPTRTHGPARAAAPGPARAPARSY